MNRFAFSHAFSAGLFSALCVVASTSFVHAQANTVFCISEYKREAATAKALGISPSEAELLVSQVASSIGLNISSVIVIPCEQASKAQSTYQDGSSADVPAGEYIIYDPVWLREVVGSDKTQAIAIFGHELGHILNRDFQLPRSRRPRVELETGADGFAGCAVARMKADFPHLVDLLGRIRGDHDTSYPSAEHSIAAARLGYEKCGGTDVVKTQPPPPNIPIADSGWVSGGSSPNGFCDPVLTNLKRQLPNYQINMELLPEESRHDIFRHFEYRYRCSFTAAAK